ncbi:MarR family winged helix-turn-helix transcriptional regulator [Azospira inquinata]|nr:MarR family transcriptional regulator [Azospira inquinata]
MPDSEPLYTPETYTLDDSIGYLLSSVKNRLVQSMDAEMADLGMTGAQLPILMSLAHGRAKTAADLCRCMNYDTGSMTRMLDRLEEKGIIARERSATDRRIIHLKLTPAGRDIYPALVNKIIRVLSLHLQGFSAEELDLFRDFLRRMLANGAAAANGELPHDPNP